MSDPTLSEEIRREVARLAPRDQRRVLEFIRGLTPSRANGTPGRALVRFAGTLPPGEADAMLRAIDEGCERIDARDW